MADTVPKSIGQMIFNLAFGAGYNIVGLALGARE
jgi:hypothetical protein